MHVASSLSEATCGTQDTARFAPQSQVKTFLRLVDPGAQSPTAIQPQRVANTCERAGTEVGLVAARFFTRSLRWLDGRRDMAAQPQREGQDEGESTLLQRAAPGATRPALGGAPTVSGSATRSPAHFQRADLPRPSAHLRQPTPAPSSSQWRQAIESSRPAARLQAVEQPRVLGAELPQHRIVVQATQRTSREPFPKAYELAAETIPPLITLALGRWLKPSWAQLAETGCSVALNASRMYQDARPHNGQPRSLLAGLASATFAAASAVATISMSGLVGLAATSPWIVALIGGVLLLAIIWRVVEGRDAGGPLSWLGSGAVAVG